MTVDVSDIMESEVPPEPAAVQPEPVAAVQEQNKDDLEWAARFNQLTKKEQALLKQQQELKAAKQQYEEILKLKEVAKDDPWAVLNHFGLDYAQLTELMINQQSPEQQKFSALEKEIQMLKQQKEDEAKQAEIAKQKQAETEYKTTIQQHAMSNQDFELLNHYKQYDMVFDVCKEYYTKNNKLLDINTACKLVEDYLEDQVAPLTKLQKVAKKFTPTISQPQDSKRDIIQVAKDAPQEARQTTTAVSYPKGNVVHQPSVTSSVPADTPEARRKRALSFLTD